MEWALSKIGLQKVIRLALASVLSFLLAGFFLMPVLFLKDYMNTAVMFHPKYGFDFESHFIGFVKFAEITKTDFWLIVLLGFA